VSKKLRARVCVPVSPLVLVCVCMVCVCVGYRKEGGRVYLRVCTLVHERPTFQRCPGGGPGMKIWLAKLDK